MSWFELKGDGRIMQRCATQGCGGQPTLRLEAEGVGSNYCSGCAEKIEHGMATAALAEILMICPTCNDANSCDDYEGPTCDQCNGAGYI